MAKRRASEHETHENHERWLVSYADFITLLFAFFVVMYALSSVNEGKYRILSDSIVQAFRNAPQTAPPIVTIAPIPPIQPIMPLTVKETVPPIDTKAEEIKQQRRAQMRRIAKEIMQVIAPLVEQGKVKITETSRGVSIEINDSVLFATGQAALHPELSKVLGSIASLLATTDFPITIEGHTDNIPIRTAQFPSNWELSAVRATTVLRLFIDKGVNPQQLTAIGYAETRPVAIEDNAESRARNRRVNIQIDSMMPETRQEIDINTDQTASAEKTNGEDMTSSSN